MEEITYNKQTPNQFLEIAKSYEGRNVLINVTLEIRDIEIQKLCSEFFCSLGKVWEGRFIEWLYNQPGKTKNSKMDEDTIEIYVNALKTGEYNETTSKYAMAQFKQFCLEKGVEFNEEYSILSYSELEEL